MVRVTRWLCAGLVLAAGMARAGAQTVCPAIAPAPVAALLMPPPCESCDETKAEMEELRALDKGRSREQEAHAAADQDKSVARFLAEAGIKITPSELPLTMHLFECAVKSADRPVKDAKKAFHRARPYSVEGNGLRPVEGITREDSPSYPSGHGAYAAVAGVILAEMLPEQREAIFKRIQDYGFSRMIAGAHYRSDVQAGELAGSAVVASLFANADFRDDFGKAKGELRGSLGLK